MDEAAKKAMPNTKVVDANGNPRVVYHQSPTSFNVFKRGVRDGLSGRGIYFSYYGESFGTGNVIRPFFVNVENPITHDVLYDNKEELQQPNVFGKVVRYDEQIKQEREFVAILTVEQYSGNISKIETFDVLHAISGRQKIAAEWTRSPRGLTLQRLLK